MCKCVCVAGGGWWFRECVGEILVSLPQSHANTKLQQVALKHSGG